MNDRELKLIITAEVARAEAQVKQFVTEMLKAKTGASGLQKELDAARARFELLGDKTAFAAQKQSALAKEMDRLIEQGVKPQAAELQKLADEYRENAKELDSAKEKTREFGDVVKDVTSVASMLAGVRAVGEFAKTTVEGFADAESASMRLDAALKFRSLQDARGALDDLAASVQKLTGADDDLVTQKEAELIAQGKSLAMTQDIIRAAAALSAISGDDLAASIDTVSGSLSGMAREMGRNLPEIKDLSEEQLRNGAAVDLLLGKYGEYTGLMSGSVRVELKRLAEDTANASDLIGAEFVPILRVGVDVLTALANVVHELPEPVRQGLVVALLAGAGAMAALTVRTALQTVATWGFFGAQMAANAAMAVGNPALWAGIAAATVFVGTITAMALAKSKEAEASGKSTEAEKDAAIAHTERFEAMKQSTAQVEEYRKALEGLGLVEARADYNRLNKALADNRKAQRTRPGDTSLRQGEADIVAQLDAARDNLDKLQASSNKAANEAANKIQDDALKALQGVIESSRSEVDKLDAQIRALSQVTFSKPENQAAQAAGLEILRKQREDAQKQEEDARQREFLARMADEAKYTATKLDDIEAERAQELYTLAMKESDLAAFASKRSAIMKKFDEQALQTKADEATLEAQNAAKLTATKLDDLKVEYDHALILAEGNAAAVAAIEAQYTKDRVKMELEERLAAVQAEATARKQAFDLAKLDAQQKGDALGVLGNSAQEAIAGTEVGRAAGLAGALPIGPMEILSDVVMGLMAQLGNVTKILNPVQTVLEAMFAVIGPAINDALQPFIGTLTQIGQILGVFLKPIIQAVGTVFKWLNDYVIVPFGNAIIWMINGIIGAINVVLKALGQHTIKKLAELQTTDQLAKAEKERLEKQQRLNDMMDDLAKDFDKRRQQMDDAYGKNLSSLQDLLSVGAIGDAEYADRVAALNAQHDAEIAALANDRESQLAYLKALLDRLQAGEDITVPSYDVGTTAVPRDQLAMVHRGETIIPADFSAGLRKGDLTLGTAKQEAGTVNVIYITVEGALYSEDGLIQTLARKIPRALKRGQVEVA